MVKIKPRKHSVFESILFFLVAIVALLNSRYFFGIGFLLIGAVMLFLSTKYYKAD